jgi:serine protease Do
MQYFLRPDHLRKFFSGGCSSLSGVAVAVLSACVGLAPQHASAQNETWRDLLDHMHMSSRSGAPGYLGVLFGDVDNESFTRLRLSEKRGAIITLIDHDAPAGGSKGLRVNDVVLSVNSQNVENAAQCSAILHELPAGQWVSLVIMRDGDQQTVSLQLVDHRVMERDVWNKLNSGEGLNGGQASGLGILPGGNGDTPSTGFHMPFFGTELKVGAIVEPLSAQIAAYLNISGGVFVKQVAHRSEAEFAGLRENDIILRVGAEPINTPADWDRTLKANQDKQVQVAILRDRRQLILALQVDNKHRR